MNESNAYMVDDEYLKELTDAHPISQDAVKQAIETYDDVSNELIIEVHEALVTVQRLFGEKLTSLLTDGIWYDKPQGMTSEGAVRRPDVDYIAEDLATVYFEVSDEPWDGVFDHAGIDTRSIQYMVRDAHNYHVRETFDIEEWPERLTDDNSPDIGGTLVVQKPHGYKQGTRSVRELFHYMIEQGVDPEKGLDYWMVACQNKPVERWAELRREDADVVDTNVKLVADALGTPLSHQSEYAE